MIKSNKPRNYRGNRRGGGSGTPSSSHRASPGGLSTPTVPAQDPAPLPGATAPTPAPPRRNARLRPLTAGPARPGTARPGPARQGSARLGPAAQLSLGTATAPPACRSLGRLPRSPAFDSAPP